MCLLVINSPRLDSDPLENICILRCRICLVLRSPVQGRNTQSPSADCGNHCTCRQENENRWVEVTKGGQSYGVGRGVDLFGIVNIVNLETETFSLFLL